MKPNQEIRPWCFESFGVRVRVTSDRQAIIDRAAEVGTRALLGNVSLVANEGSFDHEFSIDRPKNNGTFWLTQNGDTQSAGRSPRKLYRFFDAILRVAVGEYAPGRVFMHSGSVGWNGKAIIIPADSFSGKSTLVAELVRQGATYLSDEFAILDEGGMVHPFARPIAMRTDEYYYKEYEITAEELGSREQVEPLPVGTVLLTKYDKDTVWEPTILSPGQGALAMIPYALSVRHRPDFTLSVLHKVASHAIIASGSRGSAENFVTTLLKFVDNHTD